MKTYLEYHDEKSHKFWEISRKGGKVTKSWGRVGTDGQAQVKDLGSPEKAKTSVEKAIAEKLKKGYIEPDSGRNKHPEKFDLEKALNTGPRRTRMPREFTAFYRKWQETLSKHPPRFDMYSRLEDFNRQLALASWAWKPQGKGVMFQDVDRLGEHLLGPPYTCEEYPWPRYFSRPDDPPDPYDLLQPIAQIDLDKASRICGVDIGNGFLQIFGSCADVPLAENPYMRVIPRSKISRQKMTPIPTYYNEEFEEEMVGSFFLDEPCLQITGFKRSKFWLSGIYTATAKYYFDEMSLFPRDFDKLSEERWEELIHLFDAAMSAMDLGNFNVMLEGMFLFGMSEAYNKFSYERPTPLLSIHGPPRIDGLSDDLNERLQDRIDLGSGCTHIYIEQHSLSESKYNYCFWQHPMADKDCTACVQTRENGKIYYYLEVDFG